MSSTQQSGVIKREVTVPIKKDDQSFEERQRSIWEEINEQMERRKQEWEEEVSDLKKDFFQPKPDDEVIVEDMSSREKIMGSMFYDKGDGPGSNKVFRVCFNVGQFNSDEVSVKAEDGRLVVQARHEDIHDGNTTSREFSRKVDLPSGVNPQSLRSTISTDGILQVEADVSAEAYANMPNDQGNKTSNGAPSPFSLVRSCTPSSSQQHGVTTYTDPQDGTKKFKVTVEMGPDFQPEDLQVKTVGRKLVVHARHEEKVQGRSSSKEFNREFDLPDGLDPNRISANMMGDGRLILEAPILL